MKKLLTYLMFVSPLLLVGCASSMDDKLEIPLDSDPRVGEKVSQVCFARNIDSWYNVDNDRYAVVLVMNNRDTYKLKLSSGCDPDWAMSHLAVITRTGSSCYSRGDRIRTDANRSRSSGSVCTILGINEWDSKAATPSEQKPEAGQQPEQ